MSTRTPWTIHDSPLGPLTLLGGPRGLTALRFEGDGERLDTRDREPAAFAEASRQLEEYFAGHSARFELALDLGGTPFGRRVWQALQAIPHGTTTTYSALAASLGRPEAVRAVAGAVARTPVPIVVPCHRVLGSGGALTGYVGGLECKQALLDLERGRLNITLRETGLG